MDSNVVVNVGSVISEIGPSMASYKTRRMMATASSMAGVSSPLPTIRSRLIADDHLPAFTCRQFHQHFVLGFGNVNCYQNAGLKTLLLQGLKMVVNS